MMFNTMLAQVHQSSKALKRPASSAKDPPSKSGSQPNDEPDMQCPTAYLWAKRFCDKARSLKCVCMYNTVNVHTEFTGSGCAESAVESITSFMTKSEAPQVNFRSMADIKPSCRSVAMHTRDLMLCGMICCCFVLYFCLLQMDHQHECNLSFNQDPDSCCFGDILSLLPEKTLHAIDKPVSEQAGQLSIPCGFLSTVCLCACVLSLCLFLLREEGGSC